MGKVEGIGVTERWKVRMVSLQGVQMRNCKNGFSYNITCTSSHREDTVHVICTFPSHFRVTCITFTTVYCYTCSNILLVIVLFPCVPN